MPAPNDPTKDNQTEPQAESEFGVEVHLLDPTSSQQADKIQQERQRFDADLSELLQHGSSSGRLIFVFLGRELRRFRLDKLYREAYILNEAYLRGVDRIAKGEVIRSSVPWLRVTSYNIIRELSRESQKSASLEEDVQDVQQPSVSSEEIDDDFTTLKMAFQLLSAQDQRLLNLKIVEGLSWQEIHTILRLEGAGDFSEPALRKRKERALIRLRKKYHAIKPPI